MSRRTDPAPSAWPSLPCGSAAFSLQEARRAGSRAALLMGGDPERGKGVIVRVGCAACHTIPGVPGANRKAGPPLDDLASRLYVASVLIETPGNVVR